MKIEESNKLWCKASQLIPMGTQTLSKAPDRFVDGVTPKFISRGLMGHVWDVDGNEFIDYVGSLGAMILGHAYPDVVNRLTEVLQIGNIFTLMHPAETELASLLHDLIPCAEMVRFAKNGSDATMGAVRTARAYTGKEHIAFCGYHGCHDWHAITGGLRRGIPKVMGQLIHGFTYNDLESLEHVLKKNECACVIMEQGLDEPRDGFLHKAVELAHKYDAVFIFDEIVTGFRYHIQGAMGFYGIEPDIACIGKAMGNGFSISAVIGKKEIMRTMEDGVFFSFTFAGELIGIEAALATIGVIKSEPVIPTLWSNGAKLMNNLISMERRYNVGMWCHGNPVRFIIKFLNDEGKEDLMAKSYFLQETVKRRVLMGVPTYTTYSHTVDDINETLEVCDLVLSKMQKIQGDYEYHLEGKPIQPPYVRA